MSHEFWKRLSGKLRQNWKTDLAVYKKRKICILRGGCKNLLRAAMRLFKLEITDTRVSCTEEKQIENYTKDLRTYATKDIGLTAKQMIEENKRNVVNMCGGVQRRADSSRFLR